LPIYEFYCPDCHVVYNFFSPRVNTGKQPACPRCGRPKLQRQVSLFAVSLNKQAPDGDPLAGLDEVRVQNALLEMAAAGEGMEDEDPRAAGRLMRRLYDNLGMEPGPGLSEALGRLEAGDDPEAIEAELGQRIDSEEPFAVPGGAKALLARLRPPATDETLYDL